MRRRIHALSANSEVISATEALPLRAAWTSDLSGFCSRSYTEALPSSACVMSVKLRLTSEIFA